MVLEPRLLTVVYPGCCLTQICLPNCHLVCCMFLQTKSMNTLAFAALTSPPCPHRNARSEHGATFILRCPFPYSNKTTAAFQTPACPFQHCISIKAWHALPPPFLPGTFPVLRSGGNCARISCCRQLFIPACIVHLSSSQTAVPYETLFCVKMYPEFLPLQSFKAGVGKASGQEGRGVGKGAGRGAVQSISGA